MWSNHINYHGLMRTHQLVLTWIEKQLSGGELTVGGRLPAERTLAEQLGVSRTSVREAIRILEAMGVVRAGVGSGPEAGTVVISDPTAALGSALRLHVATQHLPVADIVETRVLLESWAAAHARADAPELELAETLLDGMDAVGRGSEATGDFLALDVRFHLALADAAGNAVVSAMMGSLRESIQGYAATLTANLPDWGVTASRLQAEHRGILAAIRNDDGGLAAKLVAAHIEGYYREAGVQHAPKP